jgi:uncharacterized membrane protein YfcA
MNAVSVLDIAAVAVVSLAAGFVDSIAGGGGLISVPALFGLFPRADPVSLLGTNKAAVSWGTVWASATYLRRVHLSRRTLLAAGAAALVGGLLGAWLVTQVPSHGLRRAVPVILGLVLTMTLLRPDVGNIHAPRFTAGGEAGAAAAISLGLGLYDGFFGPGTGTILVFLFARVLGHDFLHAAAGARTVNAVTNLAALALFATAGHVDWRLALPMALANVAGSVLGSRLALKHGAGLIRRVFIAVVVALILKTGYDAYVG